MATAERKGCQHNGGPSRPDHAVADITPTRERRIGGVFGLGNASAYGPAVDLTHACARVTTQGTGVVLRGRGRGRMRIIPMWLGHEMWIIPMGLGHERREAVPRPNRADEVGSIYHALNRGNA